MKHQKKKHHKSDNKEKILIDTSLQLEKIKFLEVEDKLKELGRFNRLYCLHFSIFEFKVGILNSFIDYYAAVELYRDVSKAMIYFSDKRGREPKYQGIMQGILHRINSSISYKDIPEYLMKLEALIVYSITSFENGIYSFIGEFGNDEIVRFDLSTRETYDDFKKLVNNRSGKIKLSKFIDRNISSLDNLLGSNEVNKKNPKLYAKLGIIKSDTSKADNYRINKSLGDVVISIDSPKSYVIHSTDKSFEYLCPPLSKKANIHKKI